MQLHHWIGSVRRFVFLLALALTVVSCKASTGDEDNTQAGTDLSDPTLSDLPDTEDSTVPADTTEPSDTDEASEPDEVSDATDPGPGDESDTSCPNEPETGPSDGFGEISGLCGFLDLEVRQQLEPMMIMNGIDFFDDPYDEADLELLTEGGQEIISDGNAGGSSLLSEVFSFEVLARCEQAELLKTETEIIYNDPAGKKTDLLVRIGQSILGVSVTRAVGFPREDPYTVEIAQGLLEQKLSGVNSSTANMSDQDYWSKQILHIVAYEDEHAASLEAAYGLLTDELRSDTVVIVTVSYGEDSFLY
jgi:hypothetical protein